MSDDDQSATADPTEDDASDDGDGSPFADLDDHVPERRTDDADDPDADDPFAALGDADDPDADDPFEEIAVDDVDADDVWAAIEAEDGEHAVESAVQPGVGRGESERVERDDPSVDRPEHIVPKVSYCQRCEYFTDPPEAACTHEGTDILAVVDTEHFRVRGCPIAGDDPVDGGEDG